LSYQITGSNTNCSGGMFYSPTIYPLILEVKQEHWSNLWDYGKREFTLVKIKIVKNQLK